MKGFSFRKLKKKLKITVLTLIVAVFAVSFVLPMVFTVANSFMSEPEINSNYGTVFETDSYSSEKVNLKLIPDKVTGKQYENVLLKSPDYLMKFWNSVFLAVPITVFQVLIALGAAYCFSRFKGKVKSLVFFLYIIIMLMPYQVTLVPNYLVADKLKLLNTRWSIIFPGVFATFSVYLLTKYMRRIPEELIDAAKIDGAGHFKIFTKICIPLCRSAVASVAILVFIDYWNMVEQPLIMLKDSEYHPLSVFLSEINKGEIGLAFAAAVVYMIPPILIFLYGEDYLVDGIASYGGNK